MLYRYLREDRFAPENLLAIEKLRWENEQRYQYLMEKCWRPIFSGLHKGDMFHGISHSNGNGEKSEVCFSISEYGIGYDYLVEDDKYADKFIRCLPDKKVPLYINSNFETVRDAAKKRLAGEKGYEPIPLRQDLVDLYYKTQDRSQRIFKTKGICTQIIEYHIDALLHKIDRKENISPVMMSISLNGRIYICYDHKIIVHPEDKNWIFTIDDIMSDDHVDYSRLDQIKLTVKKKED